MAVLITNTETVARLTTPTPAPLPIDAVIREHGTIRPATPEGNEFFGLNRGTNGTGTKGRRECVQRAGDVWVRHDGSPAISLRLTPPLEAVEGVSPWSGAL